MIYFDNAATTPMLPEAINAMHDVEPYFGNASTLYDIGQKSAELLQTCRTEIAEMIEAEPDQIYFTSGGSEGDNTVVRSFRSVLTSNIEHHAVLNNTTLDWPYSTLVDQNGTVDLDYLQKYCNKYSKLTDLISVMYVNNEIGIIQPLVAISHMCHSKGLLFHTDAVQAVGHMPINVRKIDCDFLTASAHKFGGPKGVGFLYAKDATKLTPLIRGGHQENGLRAGTENVVGVVGMTAALKQSLKYVVEDEFHCKLMSDYIIREVEKIGCVINAKNGKRMSHIISIRLPGISGQSMASFLNDHEICVSTGSACNSGNDAPSHVLKAIGLTDEEARNTIRVSLSPQNTTEEATEFLKWLTYYVKESGDECVPAAGGNN